jgi:hypothetical protein
MLGRAFDAQFFINEFPLHFKHLHEDDGFMTSASLVSASVDAAVDVRDRMNTGFAGG